MKNIAKTFLFTGLLSIAVIILCFSLQTRANSLIVQCSYLDPVIIDFLAFSAGIFLIIEAGYRIYEHKRAKFKKQITRSIRVAFGFAILTLHVIQFIHK